MPSASQTHRYKLDFEVSAKHFVDTIPIEFDGSQIYIRARMSQGEFLLNLDTGSSQGITYTDSPLPTGRPLGKVEVQDAAGHKDSIPAVMFGDFTIGHLTIHNYCGTVHKPVLHGREYDAIIGFDLFNKGLSAKIDTRRGIMVLTDEKRLFERERGHTLPYRLLRFVPHVKLSPYPGCSDEALFDSGSRRLYVMGRHSKEVFASHVPDFMTQVEGHSYGSMSIGSLGAESHDDIYFLHLDSLDMGGQVFTDYHTMTTQGYSRIGGELFGYGSVVILPHRKRIIFAPYDDAGAIEMGNAPTEIALIPAASGVTVGMLWEGGEYYSQGLRQGDNIIMIDNKPITGVSDYQNYPFISGHTHIYTIRREGGFTIKLPIKR